MFAVAGMIGAPIGSWLTVLIPESVLLTLFALLMLVVAIRMWRKAGSAESRPVCATEDVDGPTCRRDAEGNLRLTSPCAVLLGIVGVLTGVLSGLFGVGGGFVIVPALVLYSGMAIHRAVGTSLLVITLVSASESRRISWQAAKFLSIRLYTSSLAAFWECLPESGPVATFLAPHFRKSSRWRSSPWRFSSSSAQLTTSNREDY